MRDYGKVPSTIWSEPRFVGLTSDEPRMLLLYLMTSGHGTIAGVFRLPDGYVAEDLGSGWTPERVAEGFRELSRNGFVNRCQTTKWVWLLDHFQWNPLDNPNQRKAAAKCVGAVPAECAWKPAFMRAHGESIGLPPVSDSEPLRNGSETLPESVTVTVAVAGRDIGPAVLVAGSDMDTPEEDSTVKPKATKIRQTIACPVDDIVARYHEALPMLPRCRTMMADREKAIRKSWRWVLTSSKSDGARRATTAAEALAWFSDYFGRAAENDFIVGRTPPGPGHEKWRADLDYLLTDRGMTRVIEKTEVPA